LEEAEDVLLKMNPYQDECHQLLYKGWLLRKSGKLEEAEKCWDSMIKEDDWLSYSFRADVHASLAEYDKAIVCYKKSAELEPSPKYTDNWLSIAQIYKIQDNSTDAIHAYQQVLTILKNDYHLVEGKEVSIIKNEIANLNNHSL
ncbi:MAG: tetratricopeptide repeat protein, partial [Erysipelotrichaceae bacterium]|nr:tetratricopeptide repeat protein [Erysipelotrichaceae bacterium]